MFSSLMLENSVSRENEAVNICGNKKPMESKFEIFAGISPWLVKLCMWLMDQS